MDPRPVVLILGGTTQARELASELHNGDAVRVVTSLAGVVREPVRPAGELRIGGFSGSAGLADWLAGLIEVRGIGVVRRPFADAAPVSLVVDLLPEAECPRLPEESERATTLFGVVVPRLALPIGAAGGALRVRVALAEWT